MLILEFAVRNFKLLSMVLMSLTWLLVCSSKIKKNKEKTTAMRYKIFFSIQDMCLPFKTADQLTYVSRHNFSTEAHTNCDIKTVEMLWTFMTLRYSDVYGGRQKDGRIHCDHRFRPNHTEKMTAMRKWPDFLLYISLSRC